MASTAPIAAAGGVVWRGHPEAVEIALIHRPRYDDWSLPKGKLAEHEGELNAAVREVGEELGARVAVSRRIGRGRYVVGRAPKTVTYWTMRYLGGAFTPNSEADDVVWLSPGKARKKLTYDVDRGIVNDFAALPAPDSVLVLARHGRAGKRRDWVGEDRFRPLDETGIRQSLHLARYLRCFAPDQVISAEPIRCIQTVQPLAALLDTTVQVDPVFGDEAYSTAGSATEAAVLALLAKPFSSTVLCSQGVSIPSVIERLVPGVKHADTRKGASWVLSAADGEIIAADYYEASPSR
ncbi:MAG: NUDIX hydrolase [Actinomycetota bacterium]|nr:NUDIX hydrolase [Actinomycetota bacterium]